MKSNVLKEGSLLRHMSDMARVNDVHDNLDLYKYLLKGINGGHYPADVIARKLASAIVFFEKFIYDKHCS